MGQNVIRVGVGLMLALAVAPVWAAPCAGFIDVDDTSPFCASAEWMKNRGVTLGCTADLYCPNGTVDRLQLAIFLHRLSNVTFQQDGNAFGTTAVLGTTDNNDLDI